MTQPKWNYAKFDPFLPVGGGKAVNDLEVR